MNSIALCLLSFLWWGNRFALCLLSFLWWGNSFMPPGWGWLVGLGLVGRVLPQPSDK